MRLFAGVRTVAVAAGVVCAISWGLAGPAAATSVNVNPSTVAAGGSVTVTGNCEANTTGFAMSTAFLHDASHEFAGVGAVSFNTDGSGNFSVTATIPKSRAAGQYVVTGRCGGGNLGVQASLTVTAASLPFTGSRTTGLLVTALVCIGLGGLVLLAARRRAAP